MSQIVQPCIHDDPRCIARPDPDPPTGLSCSTAHLLCVHGRWRDCPHAGPARDPAGLAAPGCSSRAACPSRRSQATPAPRSEPGSSPPQNPKHPRQRHRIHIPVARCARAIRQGNPDPSGGSRFDIPRRRQQLRRLRPFRRRDNYRDEAAHYARRVPILATSAENRVRDHVMPPRHDRNRNPGLTTLRNDPALLRFAPPTPTAAPQAIDPRTRPLCVRHPHSAHLSSMGTYGAPPRARILPDPGEMRQAAYAEGLFTFFFRGGASSDIGAVSGRGRDSERSILSDNQRLTAARAALCRLKGEYP